MLAIARALDVQARVLVLDEPTSSLDSAEVTRLFDVLRRLKRQGLGILFVTHFLEQVYEITDRLTVLRNGRWVGTYATTGLPRIELIAKMLGRDVASVDDWRRPRAVAATAPMRRAFLRARGLGRRGSLRGVDLHVAEGEVVGLAGLLGSGRTETARLLFGIDHPETGEIEVSGRLVRINSPRQAIAHGLGLSPEDRQTEGIVPNLSVRENIVLALQARRGWYRPLRRSVVRELADGFIRAMRITTPDADKPVGQLSGGNQQKVILARWLASEPRLLIMDEPTRGIDVGAKAEVERLIAELCEQGMAILFISSELEEVVRACHRVVVLRDRAKVGELSGSELSVSAIMDVIAAGAADV
jgi:simple sugar transport system ATP-binding protein